MKEVSSKQSKITRQYRIACKEIAEERERVCTGCGQFVHTLSHSHIISRAECKRMGRPELIYDKNNITYHCMSIGGREGCHTKWETKSKRATLNDYQRNIDYVRSIDEQLYNRMKV